MSMSSWCSGPASFRTETRGNRPAAGSPLRATVTLGRVKPEWVPCVMAAYQDSYPKGHAMNKGDFLAADKCLTMAWHGHRHDRPVPDLAAQFRMEQGREVAGYARQLSPGGTFVTGPTDRAIAVTQRLIATGATAIFEATFQSDPFVAKADVLSQNGDGWGRY